MEATYKIQTGNEIISFKTTSLSVNKCTQILRLSEGKKKWKDYSLKHLAFNFDGLTTIHIIK